MSVSAAVPGGVAAMRYVGCGRNQPEQLRVGLMCGRHHLAGGIRPEPGGEVAARGRSVGARLAPHLRHVNTQHCDVINAPLIIQYFYH
eukprot:2276818-Pyramimonas_sp.AAC.1